MTEQVCCAKCLTPKLPRQLRELADGSKVCVPCRMGRVPRVIVKALPRASAPITREPRSPKENRNDRRPRLSNDRPTFDTAPPIVDALAARFCSMRLA